MNTIKFEVCVKCFTYNQSKYITDALDGFCCQETSFPYVCCIIDDASIDGEQQVIRQYINENFCPTDNEEFYEKETDYAYIIYSRHKTNTNCYFAVLLLKQNLYSRDGKLLKLQYISEWTRYAVYEALCEGDDWWVSPQKLQSQYDYMESHPRCGLCHTKAKAFYQEKGIYGKRILGQNVPNFESLLFHNRIVTLTAFIRVEALKGYDEYVNGQRWLMGDRPQWLYVARKWDIYMLPEIMGVYRILTDSAMNRKSFESRKKFLESGNEMISFFAQKETPHIVSDIKNNCYSILCMNAFVYKKYKEFIDLYSNIRHPSFKLQIRYIYVKLLLLRKTLFNFYQ